MTIAEIDSVVYVSSEDPAFPAKNLINSALGNHVKKWISEKKGEKDISAIFKFKEITYITNIVVGNENSAIIEILVGNSETVEKEFKVLLPTTELLSVQDVRTGRGKSGIKFFTTKDFVKEIALQKWERVKIVCSQPYDAHIKYGLSCFVIKSFKDEDDNDIDIEDVKNSDAKKEVSKLSEEDKQKLDEWRKNVLNKMAAVPSSSSTSKRKDSIKNDLNSSKKLKVLPDAMEAGSSSSSVSKQNKIKKGGKSNDIKDHSNNLKPASIKKEFSKLFEDVRFSMSGYENPLRSDLRNKALSMGAKYAADWDPRCTHLICAFLNTPKYNKVKSSGYGKIVSKDWIEVCYDKKRRLPWRRFALDNKERQLPESEEDENEEEIIKNTRPKDVDRRRRLPSSSSDTEDEIERIKAIKNDNKKRQLPESEEDENEEEINKNTRPKDVDRRRRLPSSSSDTEDEIERVKAIKNDNKNNVKLIKKESQDEDDENINKDDLISKLYNADTDEEMATDKYINGKRPDTNGIPLPELPDFPKHKYFIAKDEKGEYADQLNRYIHAFNGNKKSSTPVSSISQIFGNHSFYVDRDLSNIKRDKIQNCIDSFQWTIYDVLSNEVEFVITDDENTAKKVITDYPNVKAVKSDWIWKCHNEDTFVSPDEFLFSCD